MTDPARWEVGIRYPAATPPDDAWLAAAARRHGGRLSDLVLESFPMQRFAAFPAEVGAQAFAAELGAAAGWDAALVERHRLTADPGDLDADGGRGGGPGRDVRVT